jgi:hypothetical protein
MLYRSHRYFPGYFDGSLIYQIPVLSVPDDYQVTLHFAEIVGGKTEGQRVFDVTAEGVEVFDHLDVIKEAGGHAKALVLRKIVTVSDGNLTVEFTLRSENQMAGTMVSAIEVCTTPSPSASPSVSASPSASPTTTPTASPSLPNSAYPSRFPTASPSASRSALPSAPPSSSPNASPTAFPSVSPRASPSSSPSAFPSASPISSPSSKPSLKSAPSSGPTSSSSVIEISITHVSGFDTRDGQWASINFYALDEFGSFVETSLGSQPLYSWLPQGAEVIVTPVSGSAFTKIAFVVGDATEAIIDVTWADSSGGTFHTNHNILLNHASSQPLDGPWSQDDKTTWSYNIVDLQNLETAHAGGWWSNVISSDASPISSPSSKPSLKSAPSSGPTSSSSVIEISITHVSGFDTRDGQWALINFYALDEFGSFVETSLGSQPLYSWLPQGAEVIVTPVFGSAFTKIAFVVGDATEAIIDVTWADSSGGTFHTNHNIMLNHASSQPLDGPWSQDDKTTWSYNIVDLQNLETAYAGGWWSNVTSSEHPTR